VLLASLLINTVFAFYSVRIGFALVGKSGEFFGSCALEAYEVPPKDTDYYANMAPRERYLKFGFDIRYTQLIRAAADFAGR
jgi:hypothetical protein